MIRQHYPEALKIYDIGFKKHELFKCETCVMNKWFRGNSTSAREKCAKKKCLDVRLDSIESPWMKNLYFNS